MKHLYDWTLFSIHVRYEEGFRDIIFDLLIRIRNLNVYWSILIQCYVDHNSYLPFILNRSLGSLVEQLTNLSLEIMDNNYFSNCFRPSRVIKHFHREIRKLKSEIKLALTNFIKFSNDKSEILFLNRSFTN